MSFALLKTVADAAGTTETATAGAFSTLPFLIIVIVMFVVLYFFTIRPQKKKDKEATERRNSIEVGDEITTIGGIVGRIVSMKEDTFILETAGERSRLRFKRWAIQDVAKLELETEGTEGEAIKSNKSDKEQK